MSDDFGWFGLPIDQQLLGCVLHNGHYFDRLVMSGIQREFFGDEFAIELWDAMAAVKADAKLGKIDIVSVGMKLPKPRLADFAELISTASITANIDYFIEEFIESACKRMAEKLHQPHGDALENARKIYERVLQMKSAIAENRSLVDVAESWINEVESRLNGKSNYIPTGLSTIDHYVEGFEPGSLYVLGARPGKGKTALAINFAMNVAKLRHRVLFATIEMPAVQILNRLIALESRVPMQKIRKAQMSTGELDAVMTAVRNVTRRPIEIEDAFKGRWDLLEAKIRLAKTKGDIGLVVIDHLHIMSLSGKPARDRMTELTEITGGVKRLAIELQLPILLCCQLNRNLEAEDRSPMLSDLRGSGSIEQDADVVFFIHEEKSAHQIIISKNRHGEIGKANVMFELPYSLVRQMDDTDLDRGANFSKPIPKNQPMEIRN